MQRVNRLLKQFAEMRKMLKVVGAVGRRRGRRFGLDRQES